MKTLLSKLGRVALAATAIAVPLLLWGCDTLRDPAFGAAMLNGSQDFQRQMQVQQMQSQRQWERSSIQFDQQRQDQILHQQQQRQHEEILGEVRTSQGNWWRNPKTGANVWVPPGGTPWLGSDGVWRIQ